MGLAAGCISATVPWSSSPLELWIKINIGNISLLHGRPRARMAGLLTVGLIVHVMQQGGEQHAALGSR